MWFGMVVKRLRRSSKQTRLAMFNQSQLKTWLIIREMDLCVWVSLKEFVICELKKKTV